MRRSTELAPRGIDTDPDIGGGVHRAIRRFVIAAATAVLVLSGLGAGVAFAEPSPGSFSYAASNTNSAQQNTANQTIALYAGSQLVIGTCGVTGSTFTGDTYLRLRNPAGTQVATNDDACSGLGSRIVFVAPTAGN